jgi:outer membrane protein
MNWKFSFSTPAAAAYAIAALISLLPVAAIAQTPAKPTDDLVQQRVVRFGVVDVDAVERDSSMQKDITTQVNAIRQRLSDEVKNQETELRKASEDLQRQKVVLAPDAFDKEVQKFRQQELDFQKSIQERNNEFNKVRVYVRNAFSKELLQALSEITKEYQFTLILRKSQVLTVADFLDITQVITDRLNKNAPKFVIPADVSPIVQGKGGAAAKGAPKASNKK